MNQGTDRIPCPKCRANNFLGQTNCWQCGSSLPPPDSVGSPARAPQNPQPAYAPPQQSYAPTAYGAPLSGQGFAQQDAYYAQPGYAAPRRSSAPLIVWLVFLFLSVVVVAGLVVVSRRAQPPQAAGGI